jgi:hypothetical protein
LLIIGCVFADGEDDVPHTRLRHLAPPDKVTISFLNPNANNGEAHIINVSSKAASTFEAMGGVIIPDEVDCIPTTNGNTCVSTVEDLEAAVIEVKSGTGCQVIALCNSDPMIPTRRMVYINKPNTKTCCQSLQDKCIVERTALRYTVRVRACTIYI